MPVINKDLINRAISLENALIIEIRKYCVEVKLNAEALEKSLLEGFIPTHFTEASAVLEEMAECYLEVRDWRQNYECGKFSQL